MVWLDAIHYKAKENGRFVRKAVYTILALTLEGKKSCWVVSIGCRGRTLLAQRLDRPANPGRQGYFDHLR
ncbi:MAG: hypothetical protein Tsb002_33930 [Wenzhouxiangellaceae bacterium]